MNDLLASLGLYIDSKPDRYNTFKRSNYFDLKRKIDQGCKEFIFISKPNLNIYTDHNGTKLNPQLNSEPIFLDIDSRNVGLLAQLQYDLSNNKSPFINILQHTVKNTADIPTLTSETTETSANIYGTKIMYRGHSIKNDESLDFSLEFEEDKELEIYKLFKAWDTYNNLKALGIVTAPNNKYVMDKVSHDKVNMYKFIVDSDGMTILFFAKYYGLFPKTAPRESFSEFSGGPLVHNVEFHADFVEDSNPIILDDFNDQVKSFRNYQSNNIFNMVKYRNNPLITGTPYIKKVENKFYLRWEQINAN